MPEREDHADAEFPEFFSVGGSHSNRTAQSASMFTQGRYSAMDEIVKTIASAPVDVATDLVNQIRTGTDLETIVALSRVHKRPTGVGKARGRGDTRPLMTSRRTGRWSQNSIVNHIFTTNLV